MVPVEEKRAASTDELISTSIALLKKQGYIKKNDLIVVTAGVIAQKNPQNGQTEVPVAAHTNIMQIETVG